MLKHRLLSGGLLLLALISAAIWGPGWLHLLIICGLTAMGLSEFFNMTEHAGAPTCRKTGLLLGTLLPAVFWSACLPGVPVASPLIVLAAILVLPLLAALRLPTESKSLLGWGTTVAGVLYVGLGMAFMANALQPFHGADGRWFVFFQIITVKVTDMGAYFIGSAIGKHKFAPRLSPAKSWEGVLGGICVAIMAALGIYFSTGGNLGMVHLSLGHTLALALLLSAGGIAGDLVESWIKRCSGVKDSSSRVAGMGGILDIIDSLLFTSPLLFLYYLIFLSGI